MIQENLQINNQEQQEQFEQLSDHDYEVEYEYDDQNQNLFQFEQEEQAQQNNKYDVISILQVINQIEKLIMQVQEKTCVNKDNAIELLQQFNWKILNIEQQYFKDEDNLLIELQEKGRFNNHHYVTYPLDNDIPMICTKCLNQSPLIQLGCQHKFCANCIQLEIQETLKHNCIKVKCFTDECVYQLPYSMVYKLGQSIQFIDNSSDYIFCPNQQCQNILKQPKYSKVQCSCGQSCCFKCKQEDHSPVTCQMRNNWDIIIKDIEIAQAVQQEEHKDQHLKENDYNYSRFLDYQAEYISFLKVFQNYKQFQKPIISNLLPHEELEFIDDAYTEMLNLLSFLQWTYCLSYNYHHHLIKSCKIREALFKLIKLKKQFEPKIQNVFAEIDKLQFIQIDLEYFLMKRREIILWMQSSSNLREQFQEIFSKIQFIDA